MPMPSVSDYRKKIERVPLTEQIDGSRHSLGAAYRYAPKFTWDEHPFLHKPAFAVLIVSHL